MEDNFDNNYECILQRLTTMKICLITDIFAFSSNFPIRFLYIVSKSKKLQKTIKEILANINVDNNIISKQTLIYYNKYILAQKIYLHIVEKNIEQKIVGIKFDFPALNTIEGIDIKDKYVNIVYNNLKDCLYEKYNSLKIFCQDLKYKNKNNKWFFESISNKNNEYFNNCAFITNDIESIQMIIYLLYYYNYLNFKNFLKVKKIQKSDIIKIIFDDKNINYILEYPRSIVFNQQFIHQLLKSNINFYIYSMFFGKLKYII